MGETTALDKSESTVVAVMFLLRKGLLAAGRLEVVEGAIMPDLGGINLARRKKRGDRVVGGGSGR